MRPFLAVLILAAAALVPALPGKQPSQPFTGRWDLTVTTPSETYPSWLDFTEQDGKPAVRLVGRVASVHPATEVQLSGSHVSFVTSEWFGGQTKVTWDLRAGKGRVTGTQRRADGVRGSIVGVPAPPLQRAEPPAWSNPEPLFDGQDLNGWEPDNPSANHWQAIGGELVNVEHGANLRTTRKFDDFRLHIEYNCPRDGNSGVYLRGRYEVQVEYEPAAQNDKYHGMGAIYGFIAPAAPVEPRPGEWESYDITLVGRTVTVVRDQIPTIDHQEIPGITGGALDSHEGEPGPIYLQGDHTGDMKFRNITISVPRH